MAAKKIKLEPGPVKKGNLAMISKHWHNFVCSGKAPYIIFGASLTLGILAAVLIGYFYSVYRDNIFASEGIRDTLSYQGKIVNADGVPPPDGDYSMEFKIFDSQTDGKLLWTEIWDGQPHPGQDKSSKVSVKDGVFTVELNSLCLNWVGDCAANGGVTFQQDSFYLQPELDYDANGTFEEIFTPRKRFTATPYSMNADKLDGHEASDFVLKSGASLNGELQAPKFTDNSVIANYQFSGSAANSSIYQGLDANLQNHANLNNNVLNLDGVDGYALINDNDNLSFGLGTADNPFTFSAWINPTKPNNFTILSKGSLAANNAEYWFYLDESAKLNIELFDNSISNCFIGRKADSQAITGGAWTLVTATYNGNSHSSGLKLYVNGLRVDDTDNNAQCSYSGMKNLSSALYLGKYDNAYASGLMDDIMIQNREQTADEVLRNFNNSKHQGVFANDISTHYLYLYAAANNQSSQGYLYFDPIFNRIVASNEFFIPNNLPYLENSGSQQDYTHFNNAHKILAYDFADSSGTSALDLTGHANGLITSDRANQSNFTSQGYIGYGLKFDNSGDKLSFDNIKNYLSADEGSVEMWVRLNNIAAPETNYFIKMGQSDNNQIVLAKKDAARLFAQVGDSNLADTAYNFTDNNWHHLALTWQNNSNNRIFLVYVDGKQIYSGNYNNLDVSQFQTASTLGNGVSDNTSLDGTLDSVAIYNEALKPEEIIAHANSVADTLYVNNLSNGAISAPLDSFLGVPGSENGQQNLSDPVFFNEPKALSLSFSEGGGTTTASHDNGLVGYLNGANFVKGYFGYGLAFDGTDDYLSMADNENLNVGAGNFSFDFWLKCSLGDNPDNARIISKRIGDLGYDVYLAGTASDQRLKIFLGTGASVWNSISSETLPCDGQWNNYLVSADLGQSKYFLYKNGWFDNGQTGETINSQLGSLDNNAEFDLGASFGSPYTNFFKGVLDSVILYKGQAMNLYDAARYAQNSPQTFLQMSRNVASQDADFKAYNLGNTGNAGIFGLNNEDNADGYVLQLLNSGGHAEGSDLVYNLINFGRLNHDNPYNKDSFGNLKWDSTINRFIFDQGLDVKGDIFASGIISGNLRAKGGQTPNTNCSAGDFTWDSAYLYICTSDNNWKSVALSNPPSLSNPILPPSNPSNSNTNQPVLPDNSNTNSNSNINADTDSDSNAPINQ